MDGRAISSANSISFGADRKKDGSIITSLDMEKYSTSQQKYNSLAFIDCKKIQENASAECQT